MSPNNCDECGHDRSMCECSNGSLQVGGTHYAGYYQHWDWCIDVRLGNLEAAATKYIFRWYKKNGIEDLKKAISYLVKAKDSYLSGRHFNKCIHVDTYPLARDKAEIMFNLFVEESVVPVVESDLCLTIAQWTNDIDLSILIGRLRAHINVVQGQLDAGRTLGPLLVLDSPQSKGGLAGGQVVASNATTELAFMQFGHCPCGCNRSRTKGMNFATPECEKAVCEKCKGRGWYYTEPDSNGMITRYTCEHPFGYNGDE